jgi:hypothetical protein
MKMNANLKKTLYLVGAALIVALIGYIFYLGLQPKDKTATLDIQSAVPTDINVTVDGTKVKSTGKVAVKPGTHTVAAKRSGFADKIQQVDVANGQTKTIRLLLTPNSQEGYDWARAHPDQFLEYEAQAGQTFDQNSKNITQKYPLIAYLPEIHPTWRVDYGQSQAHPNDPNSIAIIVTYGGADIDKQNALQWIKDQGFNPADYEIIFQLPPQAGG